jgi:integrase
MAGGRRGQGEGSIFQRSDGRWVATIDLGFMDGRRRRKWIYGQTRKEVADKLRVAQNLADKGALVADERQTVGQYLDWWVANVLPGTVKPSTAVSYATKIRVHIAPAIGHVRLSKLSPAHVQAMLNAKRDAGQSQRSVQYIHAIVRRALGQAEKWGLVSRNVAKLIDTPRVERVEVMPFTADEASALLEAVEGDRLAALYSVAVAVGLREGEALALQWSDVDFEAGTLRVRRTVQRLKRSGAERSELVYSEPKSAKSRRTIALPNVCVDALREHRRRQAEERLKVGPWWQDAGLVFSTGTGGPIDARNLVTHFRRQCAKAGLGRRRFHDLRHTCASLLLAQGVHPRVVMELLGHSQISLTMNTYSHVMPLLQRETAEQMDAIFSARRTNPAPLAVNLAVKRGDGPDGSRAR